MNRHRGKKAPVEQGRRPGDLEFRFPRPGRLMLAIDFQPASGGRPWISAFLWRMAKPGFATGEPDKLGQLAWAHSPLADCYLRAPSEDLAPSLCFNGAAFALLPAEYECLRAYLLPEGLVHHVPASVAIEEVPPAVVTAVDAAIRKAQPRPLDNDRTFGGEVEGCGGDADLDRTRC